MMRSVFITTGYNLMQIQHAHIFVKFCPATSADAPMLHGDTCWDRLHWNVRPGLCYRGRDSVKLYLVPQLRPAAQRAAAELQACYGACHFSSRSLPPSPPGTQDSQHPPSRLFLLRTERQSTYENKTEKVRVAHYSKAYLTPTENSSFLK